MKKLLCVMLCLCLAIPVMASAERKVVTALASEVSPALVSVAVDARIRAYNREDNTLTVEVIVPERYAAADIENLQAGDAIYTQGQEVAINSIVNEDGYITLNRDDSENPEDAILLYQGLDMNYEIMQDDDHTWVTLTTLNFPVYDHLLFLDEIDPASGESLNYPTVHSAADLIAEMEAGEAAGPGFAVNNTSVVFDRNGTLALVRRFYVPWQ